MEKYRSRYPKAIQRLEAGLDDSLTFYSFPELDEKKVSSTNMIERLNREIRRRTRVSGVFTSEQAYVKQVARPLMEYSEKWSRGRQRYFTQEAMERLARDRYRVVEGAQSRNLGNFFCEQILTLSFTPCLSSTCC